MKVTRTSRHSLSPAKWLLPDDTRFSPAFKQRILDLGFERFKIAAASELPEGCAPDKERQLRLKKNQELFYLSYNYVDNPSPRPQIFNAQHGLFRCLLTTFALLSALSILFGIAFTIVPAVFSLMALSSVDGSQHAPQAPTGDSFESPVLVAWIKRLPPSPPTLLATADDRLEGPQGMLFGPEPHLASPS